MIKMPNKHPAGIIENTLEALIIMVNSKGCSGIIEGKEHRHFNNQ